MNPAEIVKKVLWGHGPNLHDCACACGLPVQRIEHPNLPLPLFFDFDAHRAHVASEIVGALGLREVSADHWCLPFCETDCNIGTSSYWRTESAATEREPLTDAEQAKVDQWFARFAKAQPATTPQAHVTGAGVEFGAEGEIRPSVHWCFCLKPCVEGGEEKRGRANHSAPYPADLYPGCPCAKCDTATQCGMAQAATTPQAHVPAQERPNPANVGTGEGAGLEGAQIGAQEIDPKRPREGE